MNFSKIEIINEINNKEFGVTSGVYSVIYKGKKEIFIRNGYSVGAISYYLEKLAEDCVSEIREDVKKEFLLALEELKK